MRYLPIALTIACLVSPVYSQVPSAKIIAARQQTANAMRTVAQPEDFVLLAQLGDYEGARKLANRAPVNNRGILPRYIAQDAIQKNNFAIAEREIKSLKSTYGAASLWVELSKRYSELKRPADAKRTVFYAVAQIQRDKDSYAWRAAAIRLCELNERPAARRLFTVAARELLDPDPLMGAPTDVLSETAAECGFDDIALKYAGLFADFTVLPTYVQKNRDDMARRIISSSLDQMRAAFTQAQSSMKTQSQEERAQAVTQYHIFLLTLLGKNQFARGDSKAAASTFREANTLLGPPTPDPKWLELKTTLLMMCESTAQWELADEIDAAIREQQNKTATTTDKISKNDERPAIPFKNRYIEAQLSGLELLLNPEKVSAQDRATALNRVRPHLSQYLSENPEKRAIIQRIMAHAERVAGDANWRDTLRNAQTVALKNKQWGYLKSFAEEWQQGSEPGEARAFGLQALTFWKQNPPVSAPPALTKNKAPFASQQLPTNVYRLQVAELLIESDLPPEALGLLFPIPKNRDENQYWESIAPKYARKYSTAPPRQLLQLPPTERRKALIIWANGLLPEPESFEERMGNFPGMIHPLLRPLFSRVR